MKRGAAASFDHAASGVRARRVYTASYARGYRESDEAETAGAEHRTVCARLAELSASFGRPIDALDLGCGTGRHFHCLRNVRSLTGLDASPHMLEEARRPVLAAEMSVGGVRLVCGTAADAVFPEASFDLVYSIGVLGEHCPLDGALCRRVRGWLRPGGIFHFTAVDRSSKAERLPPKARLAAALAPALPGPVRRAVAARVRVFYVSRADVEAALARGGFTEYAIGRRDSSSPSWKGAHFECTARAR